MRRFLTDDITGQRATIRLSGGEAAHMTKVLRMGSGDRCIMMDRSGNRALCEIEESGSGHVLLKVIESLPTPADPPVSIILCQAILKNRAMDIVVEKASELGVSSLRPFLSAHSVVKLDVKSSANKMRRWNKIACSAAKQSDRRTPMLIEPILTFFEMLEKLRHDKKNLNIILWEQEQELSIGAAIAHSRNVKSVTAIVGPEGGFTTEEILATRAAGASPASLGSRILRAETAAITLAALLQYEFGGLETT
ncbi:MAG TPA: 16S rRNA (uracil(1498)-N(3))-methyltransferase [Desulfobacteraceae bacterium]|nr:16S rRNA (uracil(1498)-N(3))-methyltransferase [Desulfobacteraceae bacterium]